MSSSMLEFICHLYGCIEEIDGMRLQDIVIATYIMRMVKFFSKLIIGWNAYLRGEDKSDYL